MSADAAATPAHRDCENCGRALLGEYCYACGQPVKGLVRHFSSILGDFADSVLNLDSRLPRTLWPLLSKPAYLTREYFAGHRVRYVSPVRLFVFISILTFFIAQFTVDFDNNVNFGDDDISQASTIEEVEKVRDKALAEMAKARKEMEGTPAAAGIPGINAGEAAIRAEASARIAELRGQQAPAGGTAAKAVDKDDDPISFNGKPWDAKTNPLTVSWLPQFANDWINAQVGRGMKNVKRMKEDPELFKDAMLSAVPSTLFILLPLFALMLKILYVFKRRLYMEHLIVALHSHAFLCLALLLMFLTMSLQNWLAPSDGPLRAAFGFVESVVWIWMPVYLLLMQKRVYAQGWTMTLLKYCVLGFCYFMLLTAGAVFTTLFSLVWM
ncbi:DUF3667 domain-containing protein [Luteimonas cucumeris]|nr:DUF3667 domain-containing protein [Luteimonas cucumeris]